MKRQSVSSQKTVLVKEAEMQTYLSDSDEYHKEKMKQGLVGREGLFCAVCSGKASLTVFIRELKQVGKQATEKAGEEQVRRP